jgi:hypothetical protein
MIEKFWLLSKGDKFRLATSLLYLLMGVVIAIRGLSVGLLPVLLGLVFLGFGIYRLFYFYRFFFGVTKAKP